MTEKIPISGLKSSGPLAAVWIDPAKPGQDLAARFCSMLSGLRANIAYMTAAGPGLGASTFCCIEPADQPKVEAMVAQDPYLAASVRFGQVRIGLLSIYPHKASLRVFGAALHALSESGIMLYGAASSISALTFVMDFDRLQEAVFRLSGPLMLPANATPVQTEIKVRQSEPGPEQRRT